MVENSPKIPSWEEKATITITTTTFFNRYWLISLLSTHKVKLGATETSTFGRLTKATVSAGANGSSASWTREWRILLLCDASRPPFSSKPLPLQIDRAATCRQKAKCFQHFPAVPVFLLQTDMAQTTRCSKHFPVLPGSHLLQIDRAHVTRCNSNITRTCR